MTSNKLYTEQQMKDCWDASSEYTGDVFSYNEFGEPITAPNREQYLSGIESQQGAAMRWVEVKEEKDVPEGEVLYEWNILLSSGLVELKRYGRYSKTIALELLEDTKTLRYLDEPTSITDKK